MVWRLSSWIALALLGVILVFFLSRERHRFVFKFLLGLAFTGVLNVFIKYFLNVPRPLGFGLGPSFPSAHAQLVFFSVLLACMEVPVLGLFLGPVAILVGLSRIGMGFHTPADVVGGALLGLVVAKWVFEVKLREIHVRELARQLCHFAGILFVPLGFFSPALASLSAFSLLIVFYLVPRTRLVKHADFFKREEEKEYEGAMLFAFSIGLLFGFFPLLPAVAGVLALSVGDAAASVYGKHFARRFFHGISLEGTVACFLFTYLAVLPFFGAEVAFFSAVVGMVMEWFPRKVDNLSIPLGVAMVLVVLGF